MLLCISIPFVVLDAPCRVDFHTPWGECWLYAKQGISVCAGKRHSITAQRTLLPFRQMSPVCRERWPGVTTTLCSHLKMRKWNIFGVMATSFVTARTSCLITVKVKANDVRMWGIFSKLVTRAFKLPIKMPQTCPKCG